jgi:four helix bundle protein
MEFIPLDERLLKFSGAVIRFLKTVRKGPLFRPLADQLLRSCTAIGANYEEATGAESTADFIHKMQVSLKESRETCYWLKVFVEGELVEAKMVAALLDEAIQIRRMLIASVNKAKSRR